MGEVGGGGEEEEVTTTAVPLPEEVRRLSSACYCCCLVDGRLEAGWRDTPQTVRWRTAQSPAHLHTPTYWPHSGGCGLPVQRGGG